MTFKRDDEMMNDEWRVSSKKRNWASVTNEEWLKGEHYSLKDAYFLWTTIDTFLDILNIDKEKFLSIQREYMDKLVTKLREAKGEI